MFYAFIFLIILGYILNLISRKYTLNKVSYKRKLSDNYVEIDEELHLYSIVENKKILPVTFLQITEKFPVSMKYKFSADEFSKEDGMYHTSTMLLMPYQRIKRDYTVKFKERGRYLLRSVTLTAGDLLGLNTISRQLECDESIVVYPKALDISNEVTKIGDFLGDISVKRWIVDDPLVTAGIREYTGFEPEKAIHWPSSLRNGRLMVRNFDHTSDNSVFIILNIECGRPYWSAIDQEIIEKCYSLTRALMDEFEKEHVKYGFTTNAHVGAYFSGENYIRPSLGQDHYYNILESIGCAGYDISIPFEKLISNTFSWHLSCRTYLVITPIILEEYTEIIDEIRNNADKTVLFSIKQKNLNRINEGILKYSLVEK